MSKSLFERTRFKLGWNFELELIPHPDMYIFFEKVTKSRISYISNRYCKANNKYLKSYDQKQESKHVTYLDANNLYDYAMSNFFLKSLS